MKWEQNLKKVIQTISTLDQYMKDDKSQIIWMEIITKKYNKQKLNLEK